jgi:hypothetical protein
VTCLPLMNNERTSEVHLLGALTRPVRRR